MDAFLRDIKTRRYVRFIVIYKETLRLMGRPPELNDISVRGVYYLSEYTTCVVYGFSLAGIMGSNPAWGHGCLSLVSVAFCQVQVSATGRSLVQRSPTECLCVLIVTKCNNNPLQLHNKLEEEVRLRKKEDTQHNQTSRECLKYNGLK
jgi:hypothetical protein